MGQAIVEAVAEDQLEKMSSWRLSVDNGSSEGMSSSCLGDLPCDDIEDDHGSSSDASSPLGWPLGRSHNAHSEQPLYVPSHPSTITSNGVTIVHHEKREMPRSKAQMSEIELMKERFAKLLLGEDMSGGAKGVSSALAISNAITNLSASVFGEIWRLEPLSVERKLMWRREMDWLLSVADYVVELVPSWQTFPDGHDLEVMVTRPRSDLHINLPALRKLDAMLLESLDTFNVATEFWYVEQDNAMNDHEDLQTMPLLHRQEEKWWLPSPRVPLVGLSSEIVKHLKHQRESINQILKAALSINNQTLSEMEVPEVYWETLPKNGKASVGEQMYKHITSQYFSPEAALCSLDLTTDHSTLELANRIEAAIHVWRRKRQQRRRARSRVKQQPAAAYRRGGLSCGPQHGHIKFDAKASWGIIRDFVLDMDRRELLAARAESLLLCLKQKFPDLPQSLLDRIKIQYNKDVGQSILESYSRVLESLASNIISRIDDVLHIDQMTRRCATS